MSSTIFALASAAGRAAVAVIRVSGPSAGSASKSLIGRLPEPRLATLARLRDLQGQILDQALVLWFPAPHSFTGEDCLELQVHGGRAGVAAVLSALGQIPDLRMAEAGEFSRRAFSNGKLDLAQAEGLADLIDSETEAQRRQAIRQLDGVLGRKVVDWQQNILAMRVQIEADLDFSDEGDVNPLVLDRLIESAAKLIPEIDAALVGYQRARHVLNGFHIAIVGAPNVGKSSLLNCLAEREAAIVSEEAGTTRDLVQVSLLIGDIPVILTDTAGLRETEQAVEKLGIERAKRAAEGADLLLFLITGDADRPQSPFETPTLWVQTKQDIFANRQPGMDAFISAKTGFGVEELYSVLGRYLADLPQGSGLITRERHAAALQGCRAALQRVVEAQPDLPLELLSEDLRVAAFELGRIIGQYGVEDILGVLFSTFCIGK
eukprot:gene10069-10139_t